MSLNEKQLMGLRRQLEEIRDRGRSDQQSLAELTEGLAGASSGDLSNAPVHLGDKGTEEFLHGMGTVLLGNEQMIVDEAVEALRRMDEGTYGECEGCGDRVPIERLRAVPATRYCRECAESEELQSPSIDFNAGRPKRPAETLMGNTSGAAAREGAAGTPGGGAAGGGLAGGNYGHGDPLEGEIEAEMEGGSVDPDESEETMLNAAERSSEQSGEATPLKRPRRAK